MTFEVLKTEGKARLSVMDTRDGQIKLPGFMNVATAGAIRGAVSALDLEELHCQVMLCNTYHLHIRPGDDVVRQMGGLRGFTGWKKPTLTDSGGFQVFSLAQLRKITEEGVAFRSHVDGKAIFMGPEESMRIQSNLGSTIAMAFDECVENPAKYEYAKKSVERTVRWLERCKAEHDRLNAAGNCPNPEQLLFGINQGSTFEDLRIGCMRSIADMELDGYAIGGLAVGETADEMYRIIEAVEPYMPANKARYLMGVGTPANILEAVRRGVDLFDCVMPSRNARHGHVFTSEGIRNLNNSKYITDPAPIDERCGCPTCRSFSRGYIHHLIKAKEMLAHRLCVMHNLWFYNTFMEQIRDALAEGRFDEFYKSRIPTAALRI